VRGLDAVAPARAIDARSGQRDRQRQSQGSPNDVRADERVVDASLGAHHEVV
jgi:hypothetical protein